MNTIIWTSPNKVWRCRRIDGQAGALVWDVLGFDGKYRYTDYLDPAPVMEMATHFYRLACKGQRPTETVAA